MSSSGVLGHVAWSNPSFTYVKESQTNFIYVDCGEKSLNIVAGNIMNINIVAGNIININKRVVVTIIFIKPSLTVCFGASFGLLANKDVSHVTLYM